MSLALVLALAIILGLIAANTVVSMAVARSVYYSSGQKTIQIAIFWLLPAVGAALIGVFLYSQRDNPIHDTRAYPENSEKAVAIEFFNEVRHPEQH